MALNGTKLSNRQEKGIEALLSHDSIVKASESSGIPKRTFFTWLSQPEFKERLKAERQRIRDDAIEILKSLFSRSVNKLSELLDDEPRIAIRACQLILDFNL